VVVGVVKVQGRSGGEVFKRILADAGSGGRLKRLCDFMLMLMRLPAPVAERVVVYVKVRAVLRMRGRAAPLRQRINSTQQLLVKVKQRSTS
jgi:hypothetical protein